MGSLRWFTAGESHGPGLTVIVEGLPAGVPLTEAYIRTQLARRQLGYGRGGRMKIETDYAHIPRRRPPRPHAGQPRRAVDREPRPQHRQRPRQAPLDRDDGRRCAARGQPEPTPVTRVRPGHADLAAALKYGYDDVRNSLERASARESAARVAAGAIARSLAEQVGARFYSQVVRIADVARRHC